MNSRKNLEFSLIFRKFSISFQIIEKVSISVKILEKFLVVIIFEKFGFYTSLQRIIENRDLKQNFQKMLI